MFLLPSPSTAPHPSFAIVSIGSQSSSHRGTTDKATRTDEIHPPNSFCWSNVSSSTIPRCHKQQPSLTRRGREGGERRKGSFLVLPGFSPQRTRNGSTERLLFSPHHLPTYVLVPLATKASPRTMPAVGDVNSLARLCLTSKGTNAWNHPHTSLARQ